MLLGSEDREYIPFHFIVPRCLLIQPGHLVTSHFEEAARIPCFECAANPDLRQTGSITTSNEKGYSLSQAEECIDNQSHGWSKPPSIKPLAANKDSTSEVQFLKRTKSDETRVIDQSPHSRNLPLPSSSPLTPHWEDKYMRRVDWNQLQRKKNIERLGLEKGQRTLTRKRSAQRRAFNESTGANEPMRWVDFKRIQKAAGYGRSNSMPIAKSRTSTRRRNKSRTLHTNNSVEGPQKLADQVVAAYNCLDRKENPDQETHGKVTPYTAPLTNNPNPWLNGNASLDIRSNLNQIAETLDPDPFQNTHLAYEQAQPPHFDPSDLNAGQPNQLLPNPDFNAPPTFVPHVCILARAPRHGA